MDMLKKLDPLGEEYFYQFIEKAQPITVKKYKHVIWGGLFSSVLFEVFALVGTSNSPAAASRMEIIDYVVLTITVCYGLFLLVATIGRLLNRSYVLRVWLLLVEIWCVQLSIWAMLTTVFCTQVAADFYFPLFLMFFALAVILNVHMVRTEQDKVAKGYYLKGGGGFFGTHTKLAKKILGPFEGASAGWVAAGAVGWGLLFARTRPDEAGTPLWALIVYPLVMLLLLVLCSPITALSFIHIHIYQRFGRETITRPDGCTLQKKQKDKK